MCGSQKSWHEIEVAPNDVVAEMKPEPGQWEEEKNFQR